MRTLLANPDILFRFQRGLLPSFCLFFIWALTLIFIEVDKQPRLNEAAFLLLGIMLAALAVSFIWARIEYTKVHMLMEKLQAEEKNKETSLQHRLNQLSFKEKDVLNHILAGKSNKEICATLFIEHSTLKSHINHIYKKLEVNSRKEIVSVLK